MHKLAALLGCSLGLAATPALAGAQAGRSAPEAPLALELLGTPLPAAAAADTARADTVARPKVEEKKAAAVMEVGTGKVKFSGTVQAWYVGGGEAVTSTFRVRRAELKFAGELTPAAHWTLMVDPSKALKVSNGAVSQSTSLLQDAHATLKLGGFSLDAGQFKLPLSREGFTQSSSKIETVERALFISDGKYGLVRDLGFMLSGPLVRGVSFHLGAFNGAGEMQNTPDTNDDKVVAGRVEVQTPVRGLSLGSSGAWGGEVSESNVRHDRLGGDVAFVRGPVTVRAEVMRGRDAAVERLGYYGLAAYRVGQLELVGRYDAWDRDTASETAAADALERHYVAGVNYFVVGTASKLQATYAHRTFGGVAPSSGMLLVNVQMAW